MLKVRIHFAAGKHDGQPAPAESAIIIYRDDRLWGRPRILRRLQRVIGATGREFKPETVKQQRAAEWLLYQAMVHCSKIEVELLEGNPQGREFKYFERHRS